MIKVPSRFNWNKFCTISKGNVELVLFFRDNLCAKVFEKCDAGKKYDLLTTFRNEIC